MAQALAGRNALVVRIRRCQRDMRRWIGGLTRVLDLAEAHERQLADLARAAAAAALPREAEQALTALARAGRVQSGLDRAAASGVRHVDLRPGSRGTVGVRIDAFPPFTLTKRPGALLAVLAARTTPAEDGFPTWLDLGEARRLVARAAGRPVTQQAFKQAVYVLRGEFERAGIPRGVVETSRTGIRLRLRLAAHDEGRDGHA